MEISCIDEAGGGLARTVDNPYTNTSIECRSDRIDAAVRFWFPLFQWILGKTISIPASALKAVRVNRYDGGDFHLEIAVDKELRLPRITGTAFNTGSVRMLPRSVTADDLRTVGLWSVYQLTRRGEGPTIKDDSEYLRTRRVYGVFDNSLRVGIVVAFLAHSRSALRSAAISPSATPIPRTYASIPP